MKTKPILAIVLGVAFLMGGALQAGAERFSVNLYAPGRANQGPDTEWNRESWLDTVRVNGKAAGVLETSVWDDINVGAMGAGAMAAINGSEGSTATLRIDRKRNQSPYNWTALRDGTTDPANNPVYMANGNASLLDAKLVGTERDDLVGGITVSGLNMPSYDVIIYLAMNHAQFGGGDNAGRGFISFNGADFMEWKVPAGQPPTTLTEVVSSGDTGNYIVYRDVAGPSFSVEFYGHDMNHGGIAGFQIVSKTTETLILFGDHAPEGRGAGHWAWLPLPLALGAIGLGIGRRGRGLGLVLLAALLAAGAAAQGPPSPPPAPPFNPPPEEGVPQLETDRLPEGAGEILLDPASASAIAALVANIGQLAGLDLEGLDLEPADLLPLVARSLFIRTPGGGSVVLDAGGIRALRVSAPLFSFVGEDGEPVGEIADWTEALEQVDWSQVTNLPPRQSLEASQIPEGIVQPEHLDFTPDAAAGAEGAVQYNADGRLAGRPDLFVHPETGRLAARTEEGHILRAYGDAEAQEDRLIYTVRRLGPTAEVVLLARGEPTVTLRGDGNAQVTGHLEVGRLSASRITVGGEEFLGVVEYVPEAGDLSMGAFTQR